MPEASLTPLARPSDWLDTPPPQRTPVRRHAVLVALAIAGLLVAIVVLSRIVPMLAGHPSRAIHVSIVESVQRIALMVLLIIPVILVHELGHALAGKLAGWRLQSVFVGPWRFVRWGNRRRVVLHRARSYFGGAVVVVPTMWSGDDAIRRGFRRMVAGGPLASFVSGTAALVALKWSRIPGETFAMSGGWRLDLFLVTAMSLAACAVSLAPLRQTSAARSDGLHLWLTRPRDRGAARPFDAGTRFGLLVLMMTERRPRDWTVEMLETLASLPAPQRQGFEYYHALDGGDVHRARTTLQAVIDRAASVTGVAGARARAEAAMEAAIFEAAWRGDVTAARSWLAIGERASSWDPHGVSLACAAVHAASNEPAEARAALARADRSALQRTVARMDLLRAPLLERIARRVDEQVPTIVN